LVPGELRAFVAALPSNASGKLNAPVVISGAPQRHNIGSAGALSAESFPKLEDERAAQRFR